jgi:type III pantothenate kinase
MLLTVDIGNTTIKVGAWDGDDLIFVSSLHTNVNRTSDEYAVSFLDIFRLRDCNSTQFDGAILSSVVPPLSAVIRTAVRQVIETDRVFVVSAGIKTGLNIRIDNPATLGADLVCAAVAAIAKMPLPCVFIGMGTATAIFAVDKDGCLQGGAFSPGIGISLEALSSRTAQLPHISLEDPGALIGKNTIDSMKSGVVYGTAAMLDGMIGRFREEIGGEISVVAFGGYARHVIKYCREPIALDDNIVLEGLKIIFRKNLRLPQ